MVVVHTWPGEEELFRKAFEQLDGIEFFHVSPPDASCESLPRRVVAWVQRCEDVLAQIPLDRVLGIIGWSFGGVVGLELARKWIDAGWAVPYVGLIDSTRPRPPTLTDRDFFWYHLGEAATLPDPSARVPYLRKKALRLAHRRYPRAGRTGVALATRWGLLDRRDANASVKPDDPLVRAIHTSFLNYDGPPVPFPVSLYVTDQSIERTADPVLRWGRYLHGGFEIAALPGDHYSLFTFPDTLAASLRKSITRVGFEACELTPPVR